MRLIDTHAHLVSPCYEEDCGLCYDRMRQGAVIAVINVGYDISSSRSAVTMATMYPRSYAAVVVSDPHGADRADPTHWDELARLLHEPNVVAIGETGLEFHHDVSPHDVQRHVFREHLAFARQVDLPVIIHDRDAHDEVLSILREDGLPRAGGVMHCFTGGPEMMQECVAMGLYIGLGGMVTFKKCGWLREVARAAPLDRLVLETDSPYLAPAPFRGKRNEPAYVQHVAVSLADTLECRVEDLAEQTTKNAIELFRLGL